MKKIRFPWNSNTFSAAFNSLAPVALKTEALGSQREELDDILKNYKNLEPKVDLLNDLGIALQVRAFTAFYIHLP